MNGSFTVKRALLLLSKHLLLPKTFKFKPYSTGITITRLLGDRNVCIDKNTVRSG